MRSRLSYGRSKPLPYNFDINLFEDVEDLEADHADRYLYLDSVADGMTQQSQSDGDSSEILPSEGFASLEPTIL